MAVPSAAAPPASARRLSMKYDTEEAMSLLPHKKPYDIQPCPHHLLFILPFILVVPPVHASCFPALSCCYLFVSRVFALLVS